MGLTLILASCHIGTNQPYGSDFAYAHRAFSAEVQGVLIRHGGDGYDGPPDEAGECLTGKEQDFSASVTACPDEDGSFRVCLVFRSPESLSGLTVSYIRPVEVLPSSKESRTDGDSGGDSGTDSDRGSAVTVRYGTASWTDKTGAFDGLIRTAEAFFPQGAVTAVSPTVNGEHTVTRADTSGTHTTVFRFRKGAELPVQIRSETPLFQLCLTVTDGTTLPSCP